jgi:hypothetical protein
MPDIASNPVVIWIAVAVMAVGLIADKFPKVLGGFGQGLADRRQARRAEAIAKDDADIADLSRQVKYMRDEINRLRRRSEQQNRLLTQHMAWDRKIMHELVRLNPSLDLGEPPPLWVLDDTSID